VAELPQTGSRAVSMIDCTGTDRSSTAPVAAYLSCRATVHTVQRRRCSSSDCVVTTTPKCLSNVGTQRPRIHRPMAHYRVSAFQHLSDLRVVVACRAGRFFFVSTLGPDHREAPRKVGLEVGRSSRRLSASGRVLCLGAAFVPFLLTVRVFDVTTCRLCVPAPLHSQVDSEGDRGGAVLASEPWPSIQNAATSLPGISRGRAC
jgi:hypothetical protein